MKSKPTQVAGSIRERVRSDGTVYYQARWRDGNRAGSIQHSKSFPTRDEAEDYLRGVERAKRDRTYQAPPTMTVSDLVREYIDRQASRVEPSTIRTNRHRANTMIDPTIGKTKLKSLTTLDVQRWIDILNRSTTYRPSTIGSAIALLNGALAEAAALGTTDRHLGAGIRRPTTRKPETLTWNEDEAHRVRDYVVDDEHYGALYHVALATGMRPGELRALQWEDVDFERRTINVRRTIARAETGPDVSKGRTKTKPGRAIAISAANTDLLKWHRRMQRARRLAAPEWHDLHIVFDRGDGRWLNASSWHKVHTRICEGAGVPRIRLHDLRHTFATIAMRRGIHPKIVANMLGHSSVRMTLDLYSHVDTDMQRTAVAVLGELFGERA